MLFRSNDTAVTCTFTDPTSHGLLASHATTDTPVMTQVSGLSTLAFTHSGSGVNSKVQLPSTAVLEWSTDTGISRLAAASLAIGNGTAGDTTGSLQIAKLGVGGVVPTATGLVATITAPSSSTYNNAFEVLAHNGTYVVAIDDAGELHIRDAGGTGVGFDMAADAGIARFNYVGVNTFTMQKSGTTGGGFQLTTVVSSPLQQNVELMGVLELKAPGSNTIDTGISCLNAGIIGGGTGAAASTAGTLVATTLQLASTSGPTWTSGSAAPASTPAYGSMYSRTAGGVGLTNLYVYTVAGWVAIA